MTIKLFRLITGEDVISDVKESLSGDKDTVVLESPAVLMMQQSKDGSGIGIGIAPFAPLMQGDIILSRSSIVAEGLPDEKLENEYRSRFGSGIVLAHAMPNLSK